MDVFYFVLFVTVLIAEGVTAQEDEQRATIRLPAEWESHARMFMVWPQSEDIWTTKTNIIILPDVRRDVARIAAAISSYEEVVVLVDPEQEPNARGLLPSNVKTVPMKVDDLWARDTLPVFVVKSQNGKESTAGVIFNFNGWGGKQKQHKNDAEVAKNFVEMYNMEGVKTSVVGEGGALETDGIGTLLVTESSLVNDNRNPGKTKGEIEAELIRVLGAKKVIWFKGVKGKDITDAHVDCLVRFTEPGVVLLSRPFPGKTDVWSISSDEARSVLDSPDTTDARGERFRVYELVEPDPEKITIKGDAADFLSSYANFLIGNGYVIVPEFGDREADEKAQATLRERFPGRTIVPVQMSYLASGGGGIHCATHEQPGIPATRQ